LKSEIRISTFATCMLFSKLHLPQSLKKYVLALKLMIF